MDPRVNAYRPDLADSRLRGQVSASTFVDGQKAVVTATTAPVRDHPDASAPLSTEFLYGEAVTVFEDGPDDWVWGQSAVDGYVGYLRGSSLGPAELGVPEPTPVTALAAPVFQRPDIKSTVDHILSMGCRPVCSPREGDFLYVPRLQGYLHYRHLVPDPDADPAATALKFLHTPYLWGGRSRLGLDCSALVQRALLEAGVAAPRDSDQIATDVGQPLDWGHWEVKANRRRGDVVAFPGHIGIMIDDENMVHANATAMAVSVDPVMTVADRCGGISRITRLFQ